MTFKIKTGYYFKLFMLETMKLLGGHTSKITKDKNGKNVLRPEITKVVLVHCNIVKIDYQRHSRVVYIVFPNKLLDQLLDISPKNFIFFKDFCFGVFIY